MPVSFLLDYWAELGWRAYIKHMGLYVTVAAILSLLGPFNTYDDPIFWRFSYWTVMLGVFGGAVFPLTARLARHLPLLHHVSPIAASLGVIAAAALPMTAIVMATDKIFYQWIASVDALPFFDLVAIRALIGEPAEFSWTDVPEIYLNVFVVVLANVGLVSSLVAYRHNHAQYSAGSDLRPGLAFLSRLPDHLGTDLIYLQMEDHYLRAVTTQGHALILMRFRDALQEIGDVAGLQVHRSWWVASSHIEKLSRAGRRLELVMSNQTRIPVAVRYQSQIDQIVAALYG